MPATSLTLDHKTGVWRDRLTDETFKSLTFIFLGANKSRSMWYFVDVHNERREVCSSPDGITGKPKPGFPYAVAPEVEDLYDHETRTIKCEDCVFQKFDKHVWKVPPCGLRYSCPVLFTEDPTAPLSEWRGAYLQFRGSSVKEFRDARARIQSVDTVWFSYIFTSKPIMKSVKSKMFAAANVKPDKKLDYDADMLTLINQKYTDLEESRKAKPPTAGGIKDALGL